MKNTRVILEAIKIYAGETAKNPFRMCISKETNRLLMGLDSVYKFSRIISRR